MMYGGQDDTDRSLIDGFYVYFAPYGEQRAAYLRHHVVFGSSVRHAVLAQLDDDTAYSIRMQSFSETAGVLSRLSNTVVKHTLGMLSDRHKYDSTDFQIDTSHVLAKSRLALSVSAGWWIPVIWSYGLMGTLLKILLQGAWIQPRRPRYSEEKTIIHFYTFILSLLTTA